ncbi:MAG TPA: cupin domain-containing protein [bacterium]|nr:cupin domain-containing protein [bacterium]
MQYVYKTENLKRYRFPTHINDIVIDRSESRCSEVFVVVVEPHKGTHLHKHEDTEQVFYVLSGNGRLEIGQEKAPHTIEPGDVIRVPLSTWHSVHCVGERDLVYLAIDCFDGGRPNAEPTWDAHVRVMCQQQGWEYDKVVEK